MDSKAGKKTLSNRNSKDDYSQGYLDATRSLIRSFGASHSKQELLDNVVQLIQRECGCKFVGIRVLDENGYIPYQSYLGFSREFWESENMIQISKEDCSCTRIVGGKLLPFDMPIINKNGSLYCNDTALFAETLSVDQQKMYRGACNNAGYRSVAVIPIIYSGNILGIIHLADLQANKLSPAIMEFVESIAPLVGEVLSREKIEQSLQMSREKQAILAGIVAGISNLAYVVDVGSYELVYTSKTTGELWGGGLTGRKCYEAFDRQTPCPDCFIHITNYADVNTCKWEHYDAVHGRYYLAEKKAIDWPDGRTVHLAFVSDITQQKKTEKELHVSNTRLERQVSELQRLSKALEMEVAERKAAEDELSKFELFFRHSRDIILFVDQANGKIVEANPAAETAYGYSRQELCSKDIFDLRADDPRLIKNQMNTAANVGIYFEAMHRRKDGSLFPVEVNSRGEAIGGRQILFSVVRDITERKQSEKRIRESEERLRRAVSFVPFPLMIHAEDGEVIIISNTWTEISGYSKDDIPTVSLWASKAYGVRVETIRKDIGALYDIQKRVEEGEYPITTKAGETRIWAFSSAPLGNLPDGRKAVISMAVDVTEKKKADEQLEDYRKHLERLVAERTAELENTNKELEAFSYSVSHDLRAPLRSIDGFSQALLEDYADKVEGKGADYLKRVRSGVQKMATLIDDLLNLSRVSRAAMRPEFIDVSSMVRTIADEYIKTNPDRQVEVIIQPNLTAFADIALLQVVLTNLIDNAWKYTGKTARARVEFGMTMVKGKSVFFLRDNGAGFDMAYADKLFSPFQRLHSAAEFPGTGIGLATVLRIIRRHGGKIWAEASLNEGVTFYFNFEKEDGLA